MDIRTRLSLILVAVSLVSMAVLGSFAYITSASLLQEISLRQLDALAESKRRDLKKVYDSWEDKLRLLRSRDKLRSSIRELVANQDVESRQDLEQNIRVIITALPKIDQLTIRDLDGNAVASGGQSSISYPYLPVYNDIRHIGTYLSDDGIKVVLTAGVEAKGILVGGIDVVFDASEVLDVTSDYTGLGDSGEAMVFIRDAGLVKVLNPLRFADSDNPDKSMGSAIGDLASGFESEGYLSGESSKDYRGEDVWYATRFLEKPNWGLAVKVDVREEARRADELKEVLFDIAIALSAFAIVIGTLLGFYLANPIRKLADIVERMQGGEKGLRAEVKGDDEIAYLSESLNLFLDQLEDEQGGNA